MMFFKTVKAHNKTLRKDGSVYVQLRVRHLYGVDYESWNRKQGVGSLWHNHDYIPLDKRRLRALRKAERQLLCRPVELQPQRTRRANRGCTMTDTRFTDQPACPHCGEVESDAWEWDLGETYEEVYCGNCERKFLARENMRVTYSTKAIPT